jgi:hypothetical protein
MLDNLIHENGTHYVLRTPKNFEVYRNGFVAATRVASYGRGLKDALNRAIADAERRDAVHWCRSHGAE